MKQNSKENIDPTIKKRSISSNEIDNSEQILNPDKIYPEPKRRICKDLRISIPRVKIPEPYVGAKKKGAPALVNGE